MVAIKRKLKLNNSTMQVDSTLHPAIYLKTELLYRYFKKILTTKVESFYKKTAVAA